jgi:hypothetical protein
LARVRVGVTDSSSTHVCFGFFVGAESQKEADAPAVPFGSGSEQRGPAILKERERLGTKNSASANGVSVLRMVCGVRVRVRVRVRARVRVLRMVCRRWLGLRALLLLCVVDPWVVERIERGHGGRVVKYTSKHLKDTLANPTQPL